MGVRFLILNFLFLSLFGLLGLNLYNLQVEKGSYYFREARARAQHQENLELRRGEILFTDKNNNDIPVALNKDYPVIYAVPKEVSSPSDTASKLSSILEENSEEIEKWLDNPESLFRLLVDKASEQQVSKIKDKDIEGVYISQKQHRYYPFERLGSRLIGFVGINKNYDDPTGLYGIESFYDDKLKSGKDVHLTIDRSLQAESEKTLQRLIEKHEAESGTIIIQKPSSGEVVSMAMEPGFDPNSYSDYPVSNFRNSAVSDVYEAGSVFKPITMSAGIDLNKITPNTTYTDYGEITLNGRTIENWDEKAHGLITMTEVIEGSINTGAVWAAQQVGRENFVNYLENYGFGEETGIQLPDEVTGSLSNLKGSNFRKIDLATASFGQGTAVTPLQMINSFSALVNGGLLMKPYINEENGSYVVRRVISEDTSNKVVNMMESSVEKAMIGDVKGYRLAGKTGTAQIPDFENGGYSDKYIHTFIGAGPVSDPKFVIFIKLDKPNEDLAGRTVVPAFKELAQFTFNYYGISPDDFDEINN